MSMMTEAWSTGVGPEWVEVVKSVCLCHLWNSEPTWSRVGTSLVQC